MNAPDTFLPVDFLQIPESVSTLTEAMNALRLTDHLCMLTENQSEQIKFVPFLKISLLQKVLTKVVPIPKGPKSLVNEPDCLWNVPVTYGQQLDALTLFQRLSEQLASAALAIEPTRGFFSVRIVLAGILAAYADAMLRKIATDSPSLVSVYLIVSFTGCCLKILTFQLEQKRGQALRYFS